MSTTQATDAAQASQDSQESNTPAFDFNRAYTAREKASEKKLEKFMADFAASMTSKFEELVKAKPAEPAAQPSAEEAKFNALQAKMSELSQLYEKSEKARADAEHRAREDSAYSSLKQGLLTAKVRPELVDTLADAMFSGRNKRVEFDENGQPLFKVRVSPGRGLSEEDQLLTLEEGIRVYAKSKEAESFILPPSGAGSQTTQARRIAPDSAHVAAASVDTDEGRAAAIAQAMTELGLTV